MTSTITSESTEEMPSLLLSIPRELRDQILLFVVTTARVPPKDASHPEERNDPEGIIPTKEFGVLYEKRCQNRTERIPTLLVNRQLHEETLDVIARIPEKHSYKLDVMLVNEKQLWPTWLALPDLTSRVDKVDVTFRISPAKRHPRNRHHDDHGFRFGDGWPNQIAWCFYGLLMSFVDEESLFIEGQKISDMGVADESNQKSTQSHVSIQSLNLNFSTTYAYTSESSRKSQIYDDSGDIPILPEDDTICNVINPNYLLLYVTDYIERLLSMDYHTAYWGGILYERLGSIRLSLDGKLHKEIDIAERFERIRFNNSFGKSLQVHREARFDQWKSDARKMRERLGLSVHL